MEERTFIMLKPGVLQRRIVGNVIHRFERKGYKLVALKMMQLDQALIERHYQEHIGKDFYSKLIEYTLSGPVIAMIWEGTGVIAGIRRLVGSTNIDDALPGTIRGDWAYCTRLNIVHASDSTAAAEREIHLFFTEDEIHVWEDGNARWY